MKNKICSRCGQEKDLYSFYKKKRNKDGLTSACKTCIKASCNKSYIKNKHKYKTTRKEYYKNNKTSLLNKVKENYIVNKDIISNRGKQRYLENKKKHNLRSCLYYQKNKDKILTQHKKYLNKKYSESTLYRLQASIRRLTLQAFSRKGFKKGTKTSDILGCSYTELVEHLNRSSYGFKVGGRELDIDHIIPLSKGYTKGRLEELSKFTNLQLLPSYYNRYIKRDKKFDRDDFEEWLYKK